MARIPRAERSVSYQPAMMPGSQGGGYAAPGQAMQSVGRGIADLGNAFAGLGEAMDKENQFNDDVAKLKASHALDMDLIKYRETFNGDPDQYEAGAQGIIDSHMERLRGSLRSQRSQQRFPLFHEQIAGPRREQLAREGMGRRHDKMFGEADSAIAGEFSKLTQYPAGMSDDDYEIAIGQVRWTAEQIIERMPLGEARKEALRKALTDQTLKAIQSLPGGPARFMEKWLQQNQTDAATGGVLLPDGKEGPSGIPAARPGTPGVISAVTDQPYRTFNAQGYGERTTGRITVNGRTYEFVNGGTGRGSIPLGEYTVGRFTPGDLRAAEGRSYRKDAFELNDVRDDAPGTQGQDKRRGLLIHDGNRGVTAGCIGIKGDFNQFKADLQAEIQRNGGKGVKLQLGAPQRQAQDGAPASAPTPGAGLKVNLTAYAPQAGASNTSSEQGNYLAARPGPDGQNVVRTLDDYAAGRSKYVTIAGNPSLYGRSYTIPRIEYQDANGRVQVLENVKAVVHDTGGAFRNAPEGRFDIPVARDVDARVRNANHALWKNGGVEFVPEGQQGQTRVAALPTMNDASGARATNRLPGNSGNSGNSGQPLNGEVIPPDRGQQVAQAAPARRIDGMLTEALLNARPAILARQAEMAAKMIGAIEKQALENGYQADPRIMEQTRRVVEASGNPELQQKFDMLGAKVQFGQQVAQATERELLDRIQAMRVQMASGTVTPEQVAHVEFLEKKLGAVTAGLEKDPYQFAAKNGLLPAPLPGLTPAMMGKMSPDQFRELLQQRALAKAVIEAKYQRKVPFFVNDEKAILTAFLKDGGHDRAGFLQVMYEGLGGKRMLDAMTELSKDAPDLATIGRLVAMRGSPSAITDAFEALDERKKHGYTPPPMTDEEIKVNTQAIVGLGEEFAFKEYPSALGHVIEGAKLIYERRMQKLGHMAKGPMNVDVWGKALREAMGENAPGDGKTTYGGIGKVGSNVIGFGGQATYIPPWLKKDGGFDEVNAKVRYSDLAPNVTYATGAAAAAGRPEPSERSVLVNAPKSDAPAPGAKFGERHIATEVGRRPQYEKISEGGNPMLGMPVTANGKPVAMSVIRSARKVWIGDSKYLLQTGQTATGEPIYIKRGEFNPAAGGKGHWEVVADDGEQMTFPDEKAARTYAGKNGGDVRPLITPGAIVAGENYVYDLDVIRRRVEPRVAPGTFRGRGDEWEQETFEPPLGNDEALRRQLGL